MVAAIQANLSLDAILVDGHNGIYQMDVDGHIVYTNQGECGRGFLTEPEMVTLVADHLSMRLDLEEENIVEGGEGPSCKVPLQLSKKQRPATAQPVECGCSSQTTSPQSESSGCCAPQAVPASTGCGCS